MDMLSFPKKRQMHPKERDCTLSRDICRYLGKDSMSNLEGGKSLSLSVRKNGHAIFSQKTAELQQCFTPHKSQTRYFHTWSDLCRKETIQTIVNWPVSKYHLCQYSQDHICNHDPNHNSDIRDITTLGQTYADQRNLDKWVCIQETTDTERK